MTATRIADDYTDIAQRLAEIEREKTAALNAEMPKAWPDFTPVDQSSAPTQDVGAEIWGHYSAPDYDAG